MNNKVFKSDLPDEILIFGIYFHTKNDVSTHYLIDFIEKKKNTNALVKIYTTDIPGNHFDDTELCNGSEIGLPKVETDWIAEVDLWGKYFFLTVKDNLQMYYDSEKYYRENYKSDEISSLMEAINYAIEYGLGKGGIIPY